MNDVRWQQRFSNYRNAMETLTAAVDLAATRPLTPLEQQGLIQGFEFTHELAWNVLKDYLVHQGITGLVGSRDAVREAFSNALIEDGEVWMDMIRARNLSLHTYKQETADALVESILKRYYPAFESMKQKFIQLSK
jgi:nucleotidyltransferase substrate binding protein (TIGR01987 family)